MHAKTRMCHHNACQNMRVPPQCTQKPAPQRVQVKICLPMHGHTSLQDASTDDNPTCARKQILRATSKPYEFHPHTLHAQAAEMQVIVTNTPYT